MLLNTNPNEEINMANAPKVPKKAPSKTKQKTPVIPKVTAKKKKVVPKPKAEPVEKNPSELTEALRLMNEDLNEALDQPDLEIVPCATVEVLNKRGKQFTVSKGYYDVNKHNLTLVK